MTLAEEIENMNINCREKFYTAKKIYRYAWKSDGYIKIAFNDDSYIALKISAIKSKEY